MNHRDASSPIMAATGEWRKNADDDLLLSPPVIAEVYTVSISDSFELGLNKKLWLLYNTPLAYNNGYETLDDIEGVRYCYGEITAILNSTQRQVLVKFRPENVLTLQNIADSYPTTECPPEISDYYSKLIVPHLYVIRYGSFYHCNVNIQSDFGQEVIAIEIGDSIYFLLVNEWCIPDVNTYTHGAKYAISPALKSLIREKSLE